MTTSRVIKIVTDQHPCSLFCKLVSNNYKANPNVKVEACSLTPPSQRLVDKSLENYLDVFSGLNSNRNKGSDLGQIRILHKETLYIISTISFIPFILLMKLIKPSYIIMCSCTFGFL